MGGYEDIPRVQNFTIKEIKDGKVYVDMTSDEKNWFGYDYISLSEFKFRPRVGDIITCQKISELINSEIDTVKLF